MAESKVTPGDIFAPPVVTSELSGLPMPGFDGMGSIGRFLSDFERFAVAKGWSEAQRANVFPLTLSGVARDAYDSLSPQQAATFKGAAEGLKAAFSALTVTDYHLALRELKLDPSESLDGFVIRFRKLMALAFPSVSDAGPLLFSHFLATLPADLHAAIVADGITSFEDAVKKVRNVTASRSFLRRAQPDVVRRLESGDEVADLKRQVKDLEAKVQALSDPRPRPVSRPNHGSRVCLCCGGRNHVRDRCRMRDRACFCCGAIGHLAAMCPQRTSPSGNAAGSGRPVVERRGPQTPDDRTL